MPYLKYPDPKCYVMRKVRCNVTKEIIEPELKNFEKKFADNGIEIDLRLGGVPDKPMELVVDIYLLRRVYASLFSNVLKYVKEVYDPGQSRSRKFVAWGYEVKPNYFGTGRDGLKLNVFSSGQNITPEEISDLFGDPPQDCLEEDEEVHGLLLVKEIIDLHKGQVGYEPTPLGNNFYFVLPMERSQS